MKVLISGAAGFIGAHAAAAFLARGDTVVGFDNLARPGSTHNLEWLKSQNGDFQFAHADVRNETDIASLFASHVDVSAVIHLAGQVAVTTSVVNPRMDFEANALGTFNVLEAVRQFTPDATFVYASTNKVYGGMEQVAITEKNERYVYRDYPRGISEDAPLDFHSPYGCSKGAADQYVRDYCRIYGLKTVVFRQSCIYGTRQFGVEDQGWVSWFTIATVLGKPMVVYGDGKQIRDLLWIEDLIDLYIRAIDQINTASGKVYNAGGGSANTLSLRELIALLESFTGKTLQPAAAEWRPGDQKVFVADVSKASAELGWKPTVGPAEGVRRLLEWTSASKDMLRSLLG